MPHTIVVLPEARQDADRIFDWIEQRSPDGAQRWYAALFATLDSLKVNPERCGLAPETALVTVEIRQITFKTRLGNVYRVLFHIRDNEVLILHVRGAGQSLVSSNELRLPNTDAT
jgi:plasmid stabilization system protein ParE